MLFHAKEYGDVLSSPSLTSPWKNSTFDTLPSGSEALACKVTLPGAATTVSLAGFVRATDGTALTVMLTGAEVAVIPDPSVTTTVKMCGPFGTLFQMKLYGGGPVSSPILTPSKNSTFAMLPLPSMSKTSARITRSLPTIAPFSGLTMLTFGSSLSAGGSPVAVSALIQIQPRHLFTRVLMISLEGNESPALLKAKTL